MMRRRNLLRYIFATGTVVGTATLSGCTRGPPFQDRSQEVDRTSGLTFSKSVGCEEDVTGSDSGWIHTTADGETHDMTFDVRIVHDSGSVQAKLEKHSQERYSLVFSSKPTGESTINQEENCVLISRFVGGASLSSEFSEIEIQKDSGIISTHVQVGTTPTLTRLPDPIE